MEQAIPERCLPRVLNGRGGIGVIGSWASPTEAAELGRPTAQGAQTRREEKTRYAAARSEGGRRQSQAEARDRHGDLTIK